MYDILFIDDNFEEIRESFSCFQEKHIRCFYSDGENHLPKNDKEKLPFKNLKFLSLDYHLENIGINDSTSEKTALSALSSVVNCFISKGQKKSCKIIINTGFESGFDVEEFKKYIGFEIQVEITPKDKARSKLEEDETIARASAKNTLRNLVIREAIEIENLLWEEILQSDRLRNFNDVDGVLKAVNIKLSFSKKIELYEKGISNKINEKLNKFRKLRNKFAHSDNPPVEDLLVRLKKIEDLKLEIKQL